jgi:hypothetical protein
LCIGCCCFGVPYPLPIVLCGTTRCVRSMPPNWPPNPDSQSLNYFFEPCKGPGDGAYLLVRDPNRMECGVGCGGVCNPIANLQCVKCIRTSTKVELEHSDDDDV